MGFLDTLKSIVGLGDSKPQSTTVAKPTEVAKPQSIRSKAKDFALDNVVPIFTSPVNTLAVKSMQAIGDQVKKIDPVDVRKAVDNSIIGKTWVGDYVGSALSSAVNLPRARDDVKNAKGFKQQATAVTQLGVDSVNTLSLVPFGGTITGGAKGLRALGKAGLSTGIGKGIVSPVVNAIKNNSKQIIGAFTSEAGKGLVSKALQPARAAYSGVSNLFSKITGNQAAKAFSMHNAPLGFAWMPQAIEEYPGTEMVDKLGRSQKPLEKMGFVIPEFSDFKKDVLTGIPKVVREEDILMFERRISKYGYPINESYSPEQKILEYNKLAKELKEYTVSDAYKPVKNTLKEMGEILGSAGIFGNQTVQTSLLDGAKKEETIQTPPVKNKTNNLVQDENEYSKQYINTMKRILGKTPSDRSVYRLVENARALQMQKENLQENIYDGIMQGVKANPSLAKEKASEIIAYKNFVEKAYIDRANVLPYYSAYRESGLSNKEAVDKSIIAYMKDKKGIVDSKQALEEWDKTQTIDGFDVSNIGVMLKGSLSLSSFKPLEEQTALMAARADRFIKSGSDRFTQAGFGHMVSGVDDSEFDVWKKKLVEKSGEAAFLLGQHAAASRVMNKILNNKKIDNRGTRAFTNVLEDFFDNASVAGLTAEQTDNTEYLIGGIIELFSAAGSMTTSTGYKNPGLTGGGSDKTKEALNIKTPPDDDGPPGGGSLPASQIDPEGIAKDIAIGRESQLERKSIQANNTDGDPPAGGGTANTLTVEEANELEFLRSDPGPDNLAEFYREPIKEAYESINVFARDVANRTSAALDPFNRNKEAQKIYADIEGMEGRYKLLNNTASNLGVNVNNSYTPEQALQDVNTKIQSITEQGSINPVEMDIQQKRLVVINEMIEQKNEIKRAERFVKSKVRDGELDMEGVNFDDYSKKVSGKVYRTYNDPVEGAIRTLNNVDTIQRSIEGEPLTATETNELLRGSGAQVYDSGQTLLNRLFDKLVELNNSYGNIKYVITTNESVPYSKYDATLDTIYINGSLSPAEKRIEIGKQLMARVTSKVFKEGVKAKGKDKEYQEAILSIHEIFLKKLKQDKKISKEEKMYLSQFADPAKFAEAIFDPVLKKYMEGMKASKISGGMKIFERLIRAVTKFLGIKGLEESKWNTVYGLFFGVTEAYIDSFGEKSYQLIEKEIKKTMAEENIINVKGENDQSSVVQNTMEQSKIILDRIVKGKDENMEGLFEEMQEKKEVLQIEIVNQENDTITRSVAKALNRVLTEIVELKKAEIYPGDKVNNNVTAYMESYNNALKVGMYNELVALKPGAESSIVANTTDEVLVWIDSVLPYIFDWNKLIDENNINNFNLDKVKIFKSYMTSIIKNGDYNMHMALVDAKETPEKKAAFIIGRVLSENISLSSFDVGDVFQDNFALDISSEGIKEYLENTYEEFVPYLNANIDSIIRGAKSNIQSHNIYKKYLQEKNREAINDIKKIASDPATEYGTYISSVFSIMKNIISSEKITEDRFLQNYTSILRDTFNRVDPTLWDNSSTYILDILERYGTVISNMDVGVSNLYRLLTDEQEFSEMQRDLSDSLKLIKEAQERNAPINMIGSNLNLSVEKALVYFNVGLLKAAQGYDILQDAGSYPVEVIKTLGYIMGVYEGTAGLYDASILGEDKVDNIPGQYTSFLENVSGTIQDIRDSFSQGVSVGAWKNILINEYLASQAMYGNNLAPNFFLIMRELGFLDTNISFLDNDIGSALSYTVASIYQSYKDGKENYINEWVRDQNKIEPGSMVFLIGKSGSGKTTYAKQWKDVKGYKVISVDDYIPVEYLNKTIPSIVWEDIMTAVDNEIIKEINDGQIVIYDATNLSTTKYKVTKEKLKKIRGATGKTVKGYGLVFDIDEATRMENLSLKENQIPAGVNAKQSKKIIDMDGLTPVNNMLQPIGLKVKVGTLMEGMKTALNIDVIVDKTIDGGIIYRNKKIIINPDNIDLNRKLDRSMDLFFGSESESDNGKRIDLSKIIKTEGDLFNSYTMDLVYLTQYGDLAFRNVLGNKIINDFLLANQIPITLEQDATKYAMNLFDKYIAGNLNKRDLVVSGNISNSKVEKLFYELGVLLGRSDEIDLDIVKSNQQLLSDVKNFEAKMRQDLFDEISLVYAPNKLFMMPEVKGMGKNDAINYIIDNFYDGILETIAPKTNKRLMEIVQTERDKYNISLEKMRNRFDIYNRRKLELILDDDIGMNEEIVLPYNRFLDGKDQKENTKIGLKMVFDMKAQVFLREIGNKFSFVDITGVPIKSDPNKTYRVILNSNSDENFKPVKKLLEDNGYNGKVSTMPYGIYMFLNKQGTVDLRTINENSYNFLLQKNVNGYLEDGLKFSERGDAKLILEENKKVEGFVNQYTVVNQKRIASLRKYREGQNEGKLITNGNVGKNNEVVKTILEGKRNKKDWARSLVNYSDMVLGTDIGRDGLLLNLFAENMENGIITNEDVLGTVFSTDITDLQRNVVKVIKKGMNIDDLQSYGKIDDFNSKQNIFEALTKEGYSITEKVATDINTVYDFLKSGKFREYLIYSLDSVEEYQVFKAENQIYFDALSSLMSIDNLTINKIINKVNQKEIDIALERVIDNSEVVAGEFVKENAGSMYASMGMSFTNKSVSRELKMFSWLFNKLGGTSLTTEGDISPFKEGGNYINIDTLAGSVGLGFMMRPDGKVIDNYNVLSEVSNIVGTERGLTPETIEARIKSISSKGKNKSQVLGLLDNELAALKSYLDYFGSSDSTTSITDIITAMFRDPMEEGSSGFSNIEKNVVSSIAILSQMREVSLAFFIGNTNFPGDVVDMMTDLYGQINPNALRKIGYRTLENISSEINTSMNSGKKSNAFLNELKTTYGYLPNVSEWIDSIVKTQSSTKAIEGLASLSKAAHILYQNIMQGRIEAIKVINQKSKLMTEQSARDLNTLINSFFGEDDLGRFINGENLKDQRIVDDRLTESQIEKQGERNQASIENETGIVQVDEMLFGKEENSYISKNDLTNLAEAGKGDFINVERRIIGMLNSSQFNKKQITSFLNRYNDLLPESFVNIINTELNSNKSNLKERLKKSVENNVGKYPRHEMNFVDYYNYFDNVSGGGEFGLDNIFNKGVAQIKEASNRDYVDGVLEENNMTESVDTDPMAEAKAMQKNIEGSFEEHLFDCL